MSRQRYYQVLLIGGAAATLGGAVRLQLAFMFIGLIAGLMGSAGLGIFPRKRLVSHEQQKRVHELSTYVNVGAPIAVVAVFLLGGNETVFAVVLGVVLVIDLACYVWMSRIGQRWPSEPDGTDRPNTE